MTQPKWKDPLAPENLREVTSKILTGNNYRLFFEQGTRHKLLETYEKFAQLAKCHPCDDEQWKDKVKRVIQQNGDRAYWLLGLAKKTTTNLGLKKADYPAAFDQLVTELEQSPLDISTRDAALLMWAGAATLSIRGSQKSKIGKKLEKTIARAALTIIGLSEADGDFRLNVQADEEVARETDAEVKTQRGWVRIEVGLTGEGNTEVTGDKIGRVGRNGVVIFDKLSPKSKMWDNAVQEVVKLIQVRNSNPVEELRDHLHRLGVDVQSDSISVEQVEERVMSMPLTDFQ